MRQVILFVMNRWQSSAGGMQTVNRELACGVARIYPQFRCHAVVTVAAQAEIDHARSKGVHLISGDKEDDWSCALLSPQLRAFDDDDVLAVVGHGLITGSVAADLKCHWYPHAVQVHFVHTLPLTTEALKEYRQDRFVAERESRVAREVDCARKADLIACVGPRIHRYVRDSMIAREIPDRTFSIMCGVTQRRLAQTPRHPTVLFVGRTDSIVVKGLDILAHAAGYLTKLWADNSATRSRPYPDFVIRGAGDNPEGLQKQLTLISDGIHPGARILVRPYSSSQAELDSDFRKASIVVVPSREEGYGLVACEALSLGVPLALSRESGIAEAIGSLCHERMFDITSMLVDMHGTTSTVGARFAGAVLRVFEEESYSRERVRRLRDMLLPTFSWEAATEVLMSRIMTMTSGKHERTVALLAPEEHVLAFSRIHQNSDPEFIPVSVSFFDNSGEVQTGLRERTESDFPVSWLRDYTSKFSGRFLDLLMAFCRDKSAVSYVPQYWLPDMSLITNPQIRAALLVAFLAAILHEALRRVGLSIAFPKGLFVCAAGLDTDSSGPSGLSAALTSSVFVERRARPSEGVTYAGPRAAGVHPDPVYVFMTDSQRSELHALVSLPDSRLVTVHSPLDYTHALLRSFLEATSAEALHIHYCHSLSMRLAETIRLEYSLTDARIELSGRKADEQQIVNELDHDIEVAQRQVRFLSDTIKKIDHKRSIGEDPPRTIEILEDYQRLVGEWESGTGTEPISATAVEGASPSTVRAVAHRLWRRLSLRLHLMNFGPDGKPLSEFEVAELPMWRRQLVLNDHRWDLVFLRALEAAVDPLGDEPTESQVEEHLSARFETLYRHRDSQEHLSTRIGEQIRELELYGFLNREQTAERLERRKMVLQARRYQIDRLWRDLSWRLGRDNVV
jgi:glycosyltransferase involved in cell wall biosynthesis